VIPAKDFLKRTSADATAIDEGKDPASLAKDPIWGTGGAIPKNILSSWQRLKTRLLALNEGWQIWTDWYEDRLHGRSINMELECAYVLELTEHDWTRGPRHTNAKLAEIIERFRTGQSEGSPQETSTLQRRLTMREFIIELLKVSARPLTIDEIEREFGRAGYDTTRASIRGRLNSLTYEDRISRVSRATYAAHDFAETEPEAAILDWNSPPIIPAQEDGLAFEITKNGKIGFAATGLISDENEVAQVEAMREVILQAVDDLLDATEGSNAFATVRRIALQYRNAISESISALSIDQVYAQGIRLDNSNNYLKDEINKGELPETGLIVGEALDSVLAIHGPMILSTHRGQQLLDHSREYQIGRKEELAYKERAVAFAKAVAESPDLVEPEVKDTIAPINDDIGEGRFVERSSDLARRANRNLIGAISKIGLNGIGVVTITGFAASQPGIGLAGVTTELFNAASTFLSMHSHDLRLLAAAAGQELSWLPAFLDWWERRKPN